MARAMTATQIRVAGKRLNYIQTLAEVNSGQVIVHVCDVSTQSGACVINSN